MSKEYRIPVIEIFGPTIQGEGMPLGRVTHFLRTGGCGYKCSWCDSMHAVDPAQIKANRTMMTLNEVYDAVMKLPTAPWLTLTGGDPCLHQLEPLIGSIRGRGMSVCVETQGELWPTWLQSCDVCTFSPKGPSSGNMTHVGTFRDNLVKLRQAYGGHVCVKVVVFNYDDLSYAMEMILQLRPRTQAPLYDQFVFQPGSVLTDDIPDFTDHLQSIDPHGRLDYAVASDSMRAGWKREQILNKYKWLVNQLLQHPDKLDQNVTITPQVHTLLWPTEDRGR